MLRRTARGDDILGRIGGEEFAILLPAADISAVTGLCEASLVCHRQNGFPAATRREACNIQHGGFCPRAVKAELRC
ncbi:diguanylate cyclase [Marinobacter daepoensis]|uniref:Diguanylate cyclase n=1 Tax=Marinobacter daepoensis TaxID=262077 RepID=A0ABS3BI29_9GAMM|nr:diguanylate cyclase [Marinobacter daepoensis]MBY6079098.1 diguanylate cyclase [Marinobacter daepoensis]